jgi:DnaJ like chaperone protein
MLDRLRHRDYKRAILNRLEGKGEAGAIPEGGSSEILFLRSLFVVMGRLAKLDGRVTEAEIDYASQVMSQLGLDPGKRQRAIDFFYHGKQPGFDVMPLINELAASVGRSSALARQFLKIQCRLAYSKGCIRLKERLQLREIAEELGFSKAELLTICTEIQVSEDTRIRGRRSGFLSQAYRILQLAPDANDTEIRRAYRRMMSRYHPDKLAANESGDALRHAQEQFLAVRHAYETISGFRKMVNP